MKKLTRYFVGFAIVADPDGRSHVVGFHFVAATGQGFVFVSMQDNGDFLYGFGSSRGYRNFGPAVLNEAANSQGFCAVSQGSAEFW
ncbi:MAG: hypothetical protein ACT4OI_00800 [Methanobacteriota archaeon]